MKEKLLELKMPRQYEENLFVYEEGLDNSPEWIELQQMGWSLQEYLKLQQLIAIECMKYKLNDYIDDNMVTPEEIEEMNELIEDAIKEYNKIL